MHLPFRLPVRALARVRARLSLALGRLGPRVRIRRLALWRALLVTDFLLCQPEHDLP